MAVSNLTLSECTCKANQVSGQLSASYNTSVYVVSCEQGGAVVLCENFTCPCNQTARRLLQTAPTTTLSVVYKQEETAKPRNETVVASLLQVVYQKPVAIESKTYVTVPTSEIKWDKAILLYVPAAAAESPVAIIAAVVVVFIVAVSIAVTVVVLQYQQPPPPKPTEAHARMIFVKI